MKKNRENINITNDCIEAKSSLLFKRLKKRTKLSISEKISIAYKALINYEKYADIAKELRISKPWVS